METIINTLLSFGIAYLIFFGIVAVIIIAVFISMFVRWRNVWDELRARRAIQDFEYFMTDIISNVSAYCKNQGLNEREFWRKLDDTIKEKEEEQVKELCRSNNISGMESKTLSGLVNELKCDALEWRSKYLSESRSNMRLEQEIKELRKHQNQ